MKRVLTIICLLLCTIFIFTACGGKGGRSNVNVDGDEKKWTFEAEYVDYEGKSGPGYSNTVYGVQMIQKDSKGLGASNGYFTAYTHSDQLYFDFEITSSADCTAKFYIRLGTDAGDKTVTPDSFGVIVNGQEVSYEKFDIKAFGAAAGDCGEFDDYLVTASLPLEEGENLISLEVRTNTMRDGATFGPTIDAIHLITNKNITLSWEPLTENLERFH